MLHIHIESRTLLLPTEQKQRGQKRKSVEDTSEENSLLPPLVKLLCQFTEAATKSEVNGIFRPIRNASSLYLESTACIYYVTIN